MNGSLYQQFLRFIVEQTNELEAKGRVKKKSKKSDIVTKGRVGWTWSFDRLLVTNSFYRVGQDFGRKCHLIFMSLIGV